LNTTFVLEYLTTALEVFSPSCNVQLYWQV